MGNGGIEILTSSVDIVLDEVKEMQAAPKTIIKRTMSDIKKRGPGWIATGVAETYGINKKEILGGKIGGVKFSGDSYKRLRVKYYGRMLTPTHFKMSPTTPNPGGAQTVKATILKGKRIVIGKSKKLSKKQRKKIGLNFTKPGPKSSPHSPFMLQHTGNTKEGGVDYIPFQRRKQPGKMVHVFKAVSLPQMVTDGKNGPLRSAPKKHFNDGLEKRFKQHMKLLEK